MESIKNFFDDFNFHARVMPILVVLLPIIATFVIKGFMDENLLNNSVYLLMVLIFITIASKIGREKGKAYEKEMYKNLHGMPTTILLRFSDNRIDGLTKARYHSKLNSRVPELGLPVDIKTENDESDGLYDSAINWLRNYANSNRETESRVYQELKEYNFWRNLYGTKRFAIAIYILLGLREIILIDSFSFQELFTEPFPTYIAFIIFLISLFTVMVTVNKNVVENKAFDYAKTLLEVCERL